MPNDSVRQQSAEVKAMAAAWPMLTALMSGTAALRSANKTFLPKWPNEASAAYDSRLATATVHPVFKRTVRVDAARPFAKPMTTDKISAKVTEWLHDVDLQGTTLAAFGLATMTACLSHGLVGVLVDCPPAVDVKTKQDETKAGIRPYMASYPALSILGWKTAQGWRDGRPDATAPAGNRHDRRRAVWHHDG